MRVEYVVPSRLKPHERVDQQKLAAMAKGITIEGLQLPVLADRSTGVILDGHHRFAALLILKARRIPVCFVEYHSEDILLDSWSGQTFTKDEVLRRGLAGELLPPKTTKHLFRSGHHIAEELPQVNLTVAKLLELR